VLWCLRILFNDLWTWFEVRWLPKSSVYQLSWNSSSVIIVDRFETFVCRGPKHNLSMKEETLKGSSWAGLIYTWWLREALVNSSEMSLWRTWDTRLVRRWHHRVITAWTLADWLPCTIVDSSPGIYWDSIYSQFCRKFTGEVSLMFSKWNGPWK
jgi:hypothetical protein